MIMGRRTLNRSAASCRARHDRLTRLRDLPFEGAILAKSPDEALALATQAADRRGANEIVIAGGAEIYREFLPRTTRVERTVIEAEPAGDAFFPDLAAAGFRWWLRRTALPTRATARRRATSAGAGVLAALTMAGEPRSFARDAR